MKLSIQKIVVLAVACLQLKAIGASNLFITGTLNNKTVISRGGIGDQIPLFCLSNALVMGNTKKSMTEHIKNRHVIIDFFATWCEPCVKALQRLDSIQKSYGDKIAIVVVTREKRSLIAKFLQNNPIAKTIDLSIIVEDSILNSVFPHVIIPHEVWLNNKLQVMAITSPKELTDRNLQNFTGGLTFSLPEKKEMVGFDDEIPLFNNGNGGSCDNYIARSILARTDAGLGAITHIVPGPNGTITRVTGTNLCPVFLFFFAYAYNEGISELPNPKRIVFETKDSTTGIDYRDKYTYELSLPKPLLPSQLAKYMLDDFNRYFDIQGVIEKRKRSCWVIKSTNDIRMPALLNTVNIKYVSKSIGEVMSFLNDALRLDPVLADNEIDTRQVIKISEKEYYSKRVDITVISSELAAQGFQIVKDDRLTNVLVIKDK